MSNTAVTIKEITFTKKDGSVIRGRIYLPEKRGQKLPTVIFCHGFGSNYRELMHHGEGFAEAGICCLFFDFCGGGPQSLSDGTLEEMTVATECRDLRTVMAGARELDFVDPGRIFLQGESMGGLRPGGGGVWGGRQGAGAVVSGFRDSGGCQKEV